jgi:hypothetical protein
MDRAIAMGRVPAVLKRTFLFVAEMELRTPPRRSNLGRLMSMPEYGRGTED